MLEHQLYIDKELFQKNLPVIVKTFAEAMRETPPWNMEIHEENTFKSFLEESNHPGFNAVLALINEEIVGATTYRELSLEEITDDVFHSHEQVIEYLRQLQEEYAIMRIVSIDRTFVSPKHQKKGIATALRTALVEQESKNPNGTIIVTGHLDNNPGIIKSSEHLGFVKGIHIDAPPGGQAAGYWFKVIQPSV